MDNHSDVGAMLAEVGYDDLFAAEERKTIGLPDGSVVDIPADPTQEFLAAAGDLERVRTVAAKLFPSDEGARQSYPPLVAATNRFLNAGCSAAPELASRFSMQTVASVLSRAWGMGKAQESSESSTSSLMS